MEESNKTSANPFVHECDKLTPEEFQKRKTALLKWVASPFTFTPEEIERGRQIIESYERWAEQQKKSATS